MKIFKSNNIINFKYIIVIIIIFIIISLLFSIKEGFLLCPPKTPKYDVKLWNSDKYKKYNNCYSYALNEPDPKLTVKRNPGMSSNLVKNNNIHTCGYFQKLLKNDYPNMVKTSNYKYCPCDKDYRMISMVIADGNTPFVGDKNDDYHFYRLDNNNKWSHKPGSKFVSNIDADGKIINDPKYANHNYQQNDKGSNNYNNFCGYYCI